jgi:aminoglycoside/choline kinase family phosphotransferase
MSRDALIAAFLARHGYGDAGAEPLAQDASFRRYLRLTGGPRPAVLMDAPPPEDIRPFLRMGRHLAGIGVSVPEVIAADEQAGLLLEEDLGDDLVSGLIGGTPTPTLPRSAGEGVRQQYPRSAGAGAAQQKHPGSAGAGAAQQKHPGSAGAAQQKYPRSAAAGAAQQKCPLSRETGEGWGGGATTRELLFDSAVDVLIAIQRAAPPSDLPHWDAAAMASTALANLFDWWWPAMFASPAPDAARSEFAAALETMLAPVAAGPTCFVHRDFFAGNLVWLPQRTGIRRIGVLDFQSAAIGHPAYDLASLLQDARRDIPAAIADRAVARYLTARPELDPAQFRAAYAACAAQRHLRVAAQWVRLARRDNRPGYLVHGPRTWRLLEQAVREPPALSLAAALDRWIPPARRGNPPDLAA